MLIKMVASPFLKIYECLMDKPYSRWCLTLSYIQYYNSVTTQISQ